MSISSEGVSVEKSFEPDDFPVPAIAFVVRSDRDETVSVRLSDEVPDRVDPEDIGFHPKYGSEFWSVEDGKIVFEREFEAGEEYTTVYGLRASQTDDVESFMSEPTLETVDPPLDDAGQVVRDVIGDDGGGSDDSDIEAAIAAADTETDERARDEPDASTTPDGAGDVDADDPIDAESDSVDPIDLGDGDGNVESDIDEPDGNGVADDDAGHDADDDGDDDEPVVAEAEETAGVNDGTGAGTDDLAGALAEQVRAGDVDDDDLDVLRDALDVPAEDGTTDARIEQLQTELADLRAYTGALEAFLDENGGGKAALEDVQDRVDEVESDVSDVRDGVADLRETVGDHDDAVDDIEERVDALSDEVEELEASVDRVEELDERLEELETEYEDAREDIEAISKMREQLSTVFGAQVEGPGNDDGDDQ